MGLLLAVVTSVGPAQAAIKKHPTAAGNRTAREALLDRAAVGRGWRTEASPPPEVPPLTCRRFHPSRANAVEIGSAASPTYQRSGDGPFVSQTDYVFQTPSEQASVWSTVVRPHLVRCAAAALVSASGNGVRFTVSRTQVLRAPARAGKTARYRVSGTATISGQATGVYLDMIVLGRGQTVTTLSISSFQAPPGLRLELRLARAAARRLH